MKGSETSQKGLRERANDAANRLDTTRSHGHNVSNEPRIPAGNGRESGKWTEEGLSGGAKAILKPNGHMVIPMNVTAYTRGPESTGKKPGDPLYGITKSGATVGPGTIAAPSANTWIGQGRFSE